MLSLGTGLEHAESLVDAVFDAAVVAHFEVQRRQVLLASPVASIERSASPEQVCAGDAVRAPVRYHQHRRIGHGASHFAEEIRRQTGESPFSIVGGAVERVVSAPVRLTGVCARQHAYLHITGIGLAPFPANLLAALGAQMVKIILEVAVAVVVPVILAADAPGVLFLH